MVVENCKSQHQGEKAGESGLQARIKDSLGYLNTSTGIHIQKGFILGLMLCYP